MFKVADLSSNKKQKVSQDNKTYLCHLRLGHICLDRIIRLTKGWSFEGTKSWNPARL